MRNACRLVAKHEWKRKPEDIDICGRIILKRS
jgi:hypothetical protein